MKTFRRPVIGIVVTLALFGQHGIKALAEPDKQVAMIKPVNSALRNSVFYEVSRSEWGWWIKSDWQQSLKAPSKTRLQMLKLAARHGHAQAQYVLGMIYSNDDKTDNAIFWLAKAAAQGHASAQFTYDYYLNDVDDLGIGC
jgi:predicted deacetylase